MDDTYVKIYRCRRNYAVLYIILIFMYYVGHKTGAIVKTSPRRPGQIQHQISFVNDRHSSSQHKDTLFQESTCRVFSCFSEFSRLSAYHLRFIDTSSVGPLQGILSIVKDKLWFLSKTLRVMKRRTTP